MRFYHFLLLLVLGGLAVPSAYSQGDCKVFFNASDKLVTVPHHSYMKRSVNGVKKVSETIFVDGASYIQVEGKWTKSRFSMQAMHDQELENRKNNKPSCQRRREEMVNGEAATVFSVHSESEDAKTDATAWISKSTGRLLRQEINLDSANHMSTRYEYSNVTAPKI